LILTNDPDSLSRNEGCILIADEEVFTLAQHPAEHLISFTAYTTTSLNGCPSGSRNFSHNLLLRPNSGQRYTS
jgi:hypothetical protein